MNNVIIVRKRPKEMCITVKVFVDENGNPVAREVTYSTTRKDYIYTGRKSFRKIVAIT